MANLLVADFYGWRSVAGLSKVTVDQKFGNHTLFMMDYNVSANQKYLLPPENTPYSVRFGSGPLGVRTIYGYVNHIEDKIDQDGKKYTRLVGLGTSKVMNTANPTTWDSSSRTGIIREIGARHRFRTVIHSHPEVLETWSTGAMSDFRAVNTLADELGFRLWVDGSTMWLVDPHLVLTSASLSSTKVVRATDQRQAQVLKGSNVPGQIKASKRTVQYGVNPSTNEVMTVTSGELGMPVEVLTDPVTSYTDAAYDSAAAQKRSQDQAVVKVAFTGDATITPGSPVLFEQKASPEQGGLWLVNEARHEVAQNGGFTTTVIASRDRDRSLTSRVPSIFRREDAFTKAVVRNGKTWEAERQERISV